LPTLLLVLAITRLLLLTCLLLALARLLLFQPRNLTAPHQVLADRDRHIIRLSDTAANTVLHFDSRTSDLTARNLTLKN
jgi:hypothetical protein